MSRRANPDADTVADARTDPDDAVLRVRDLDVYFEMDRGRSKVVDSIDLDVERGTIMGIVGESGSGKSMFAASLMDAVVEPGVTTGDVTYLPEDDDPVDVLDIPEEELRRRRWEDISMVFQGAQSSFNPTMTIRGHFEETINAHSYPLSEAMDHARELISTLHMEPERVLDSYPHQLSGGMKQRTLIALSLVLEPEVLILDEPTASLDLLMQQTILTLLDRVKGEYDLTMIFITHDIPLVTQLADEITIMYAFQFVERASTETILRDPAHPYTRLLLRSTPNVRAPVDEMEPISGSGPDPVAVPSGCAFHPRCPLATPDCEQDDPQRRVVEPDHDAACFHWEDSAEAIPSTWLGGEG